MEVFTYPCGPLHTNAYLLVKGESALLIDPGMDSQDLLRVLDKAPWDLLAILITHAHFDHIGGLVQVLKQRKAPVYIHHLEAEWLYQPEHNGSLHWPVDLVVAPPADVILHEEKKLEISPFQIEVIHTPGHSPGSLSYVIDGQLFCGDLLFAGSVGRVDLPGGDGEVMVRSLGKILTQLPADMKVYPGHGPETTLALEKRINPYLLPLNLK
ncbi:MBL fold metallo-hydrolase [Rubeoparvulum massiliense]|uniref:MBL fold metallo-hydrolase n=1 Tax=Rubeoparvulum massiliense TaxID=1631346 RepID=UPI00065DDA52|nr:MBL fold metallo-hydrolase [Rubeoparvulum massiliense]